MEAFASARQASPGLRIASIDESLDSLRLEFVRVRLAGALKGSASTHLSLGCQFLGHVEMISLDVSRLQAWVWGVVGEFASLG